MSGRLRIWLDKTYFWPDIVRWSAIIIFKPCISLKQVFLKTWLPEHKIYSSKQTEAMTKIEDSIWIIMQKLFWDVS